MGGVGENMDELERALLEIEAMLGIFCHHFSDESHEAEFVVTTPEAFERARTVIECRDDCTESFDVPRLDVEAIIHCNGGSSGCARLRIGLPPGYPSFVNAEVTVLSVPNNYSRRQLDELSTTLRSLAKELLGSEVLMEIMNKCRVAMEDWDRVLDTDKECRGDGCVNRTESIGRRWIWVHHITNSTRLKQIVSEAQTLKLGGFLKGGYPGVVVVEGNANSCDSFVSWIKGNKSRPGGFGRNWGHHVRGETIIEKRQLPECFEELEDMGKLGALCKEFGVEEEFREFILQHR
ncbi:hypothetical protein ACHAWF_015810 [Thalassiosira exigua]